MGKANKWAILLIPVLVLMFFGLAMAKADGNGLRSLHKSATFDAKMIDVNQISAWIPNDGLLCSDPSTGQSGLWYPKGGPTNQSIIYTAGLWVLGKINNDVRTAIADYSTEFQPGLILSSGAGDDPAASKYQVFKFKAEDWDSPTSAAERAEAINQGMEDKMYGDQMLYFVMNDYASHAAVFTKAPIGLEVHTTVFGFNRVGPLGSTIFMKYTFINKGAEDLTEAYCAQFFDPDLGQSNDDAVGCDTTLGIGYVYNMDNYDDNYGNAVPAFGCDFFQGPVVPSPGSVANLPGQAPLLDHKIMSMTSFASYINGGPDGMNDPDLGSAAGAQQAYWFCQGLKGNGAEWTDPSKGNAVSKWLWYGDPVQGTGWLQKDTWPGADMRMSLASGPFTLLRNTPYTIVLGYVVGQGTNNLSSVEIMKSYDKSAQTAYDLNFQIAKPADYPVVTVGEMDRQITLSWDNKAVNYRAEDKVNLDTTGAPSYYEFQGYKMYQGESEAGPWSLIKQWDKNDGITKIWDYVYDAVSGENIWSVVENAKDTGLTFSFIIDKDYLANTPLINGKPYYFSLTTYSYNEWGSPRVLENSTRVTTIIPQKPVLNTKIFGKAGQSLTVNHTSGPSDGSVKVKVINPSALTGHDYNVSFYNDAEGNTLWKIVDSTLGVEKITGLSHQATAATIDTDEEFPVVDGLQVKVAGSPIGMKGWAATSADRWWTWASGNNGSTHDFEGFDPTYSNGIHGTMGWGGNWTDVLTGLDTVTPTQVHNIEFTFVTADANGDIADLSDPNVTMAYRYLRSATAAPAKPEFAPFIVKANAGYAFQDRRPVPFKVVDLETGKRLNVGFLENNRAVGRVDGKWWPPTNTEMDAGGFDNAFSASSPREWLFIFNTEYTVEDSPVLAIDCLNNPIPMMYWILCGRRGTSLPVNGAKFTIYANHPNSSVDTFAWTTNGLGKVSSSDIAKERMEDIQVFPNPYFGTNEAETDFFAQFVTFSNLPEKCTIRIFSLSGQMIRAIVHDNLTPFERWNLQNIHNLPVASGMYICLVEVPDIGTKVLKLAVINREARYQHM